MIFAHRIVQVWHSVVFALRHQTLCHDKGCKTAIRRGLPHAHNERQATTMRQKTTVSRSPLREASPREQPSHVIFRQPMLLIVPVKPFPPIVKLL
jgi:hypothetical protein